MLIVLTLVTLILTGCISANSRVGINKDRSVDIIYTTIFAKEAIDVMDLSTTVAQLKKHGFTVTSRVKTNGDQIVTSTIHLLDISDLKTLKLNDTTLFFTNFQSTITKKTTYDQLVLTGKLPVLDPPDDPSGSASSEIKSRLTFKFPYTVTANNADIVDDNIYEWEGNDADPASFSVTLQLPKVVAPTKINVSSTTVSLSKGATLTLQPTLVPANVTNKGLRYSTSSAAIATVTAAGVVKGVNAGTATITIMNADKTINTSVKVTVK